jgi:glycosyltransferase involved in cell wall biosynthesis
MAVSEVMATARRSVMSVAASVAVSDGGPATVVVGTNVRLRHRGHDAIVVSTDADGRRRLDVPRGQPIDWRGARVLFTRVHAPRNISASIPQFVTVMRLARSVEVIHLHGLYTFQAVVVAILSQASRVPFVLQVHGVLEPYQRQRSRLAKRLFDLVVGDRILNTAAAVIFATQSERERALDRVDARRAVVIPLSADLAPAMAASERPLWWRDDFRGRPLVTYMGRIAPKKRLDLLLEAWPAIHSRRPAQLLIAGPDDDGIGRQLRERYVGEAWMKSVHWLGTVTGTEKTELLRRSAVFALPSENENFGVSVVEALAVGLPVVISRNVALHTLVASYGAGQVLEELSAEEVTTAILDVLDDTEAMDRMRLSARQLAHDHFSSANTIIGLESLYARVAGST